MRLTLVVAVVLLLLAAGAALAADPTDKGFGTEGIAEIEAFGQGGDEQVGGIVDLERARQGKLLAAVYPIARGGRYFAAARIDRNGALDKSFGEGGFSAKVSRPGERHGQGFTQAEAVAQQKNGDVVLAGYFEHDGGFAPALARFTPGGKLDPSFAAGGKLLPSYPTSEGKRLYVGEAGGERLHDVAIAADGDIICVGGNNEEHGQRRDPGSAALVLAYRPDGEVDRRFGDRGRFTVKVPRSGSYTGFTEVKALPSGKLLVSGYVRNQIVLYRLTARGKRDRSFGGGDGKVTLGEQTSTASNGFIRAPFAVERSGRIVLSGGLFRGGFKASEEPLALARFLPDGRRDNTFGSSIYMPRSAADQNEPVRRKHVQFFRFEPQGLAIDGKGRVVVTGIELAPYVRGQQEGGYEYFSARRFLPDGRADKSFGDGGTWPTNPPGSQSEARAAVTQGNGQVVAGGWIQLDRNGGNGVGNTAMLLTRYR